MDTEGKAFPRGQATVRRQHKADEWKKIQQKTFTNWFNDRMRGNLKVAKKKVDDLETDLIDGLLLIDLIEKLANKKVGRYTKKPMNKVQCIENLGTALRFIMDQDIKLVNIGKLKLHTFLKVHKGLSFRIQHRVGMLLKIVIIIGF